MRDKSGLISEEAGGVDRKSQVEFPKREKGEVEREMEEKGCRDALE